MPGRQGIGNQWPNEGGAACVLWLFLSRRRQQSRPGNREELRPTIQITRFVCRPTVRSAASIVATHRWPVVGCWRRVGRHNVWLTHTSCKGENGGTDVSAIRLDLLLNAMSSWSLYTSAARSGFNSVT